LPENSALAVAVGKRKTAIARVRIRLGTGQVVVNGRPMQEYFPREVLCTRIRQPFEMTNTEGRYDVTARLTGGGPAGQADALRHGISRVLEKVDPMLRSSLKRTGLLTRDDRKKERKKYGQRGARARYQFSKR
jgi:small subunit ribosomal protein S9